MRASGGMVAARLETMRHRGDRRSEQDANLHVSRDEAAAILNVSTRTVAHAAVVRDHAAPELQRAVDQGKIAGQRCGQSGYAAGEAPGTPKGVSYAPNSGYIAASRYVKSWASSGRRPTN